MPVVFHHIISTSRRSFFLVAVGLLSACATQKKATNERERPAVSFNEQNLNAPVEPPAPAPTSEPVRSSVDKNSSRDAGKGKSGSRQPARRSADSNDDGKSGYDDFDDDEAEEESSNIFFQYASWTLSPAAKKELSRVAATLRRSKSARVILKGHTCNTSSPSVNIRLSQKRAEAASSYLQQAGVSARRISVEAYGLSQPLVPNTSERNRAKNRRVEITIEE